MTKYNTPCGKKLDTSERIYCEESPILVSHTQTHKLRNTMHITKQHLLVCLADVQARTRTHTCMHACVNYYVNTHSNTRSPPLSLLSERLLPLSSRSPVATKMTQLPTAACSVCIQQKKRAENSQWRRAKVPLFSS